jgi:hypothetical protein
MLIPYADQADIFGLLASLTRVTMDCWADTLHAQQDEGSLEEG